MTNILIILLSSALALTTLMGATIDNLPASPSPVTTTTILTPMMNVTETETVPPLTWCIRALFNLATSCSVHLQLGATSGSRALTTSITTWNRTSCCQIQALHDCIKRQLTHQQQPCEASLAFTGATGDRFREKDAHCSANLLKNC